MWKGRKEVGLRSAEESESGDITPDVNMATHLHSPPRCLGVHPPSFGRAVIVIKRNQPGRSVTRRTSPTLLTCSLSVAEEEEERGRGD